MPLCLHRRSCRCSRENVRRRHTSRPVRPEFLVCNRGVIINMSKVLRFEGDCIEMLDGTHLPVRQKDKNSLLAQFTQYQFRGMQREF